MATLTKEESMRGIRLSEMSPELQGQVEKLGIDEDGDGEITRKEMEKLIESYLDTKKDNKFLRHLVTVLVIFSFLLTGCVFGASITAARLSEKTSVDPVNGIMYAKGSETPIQTEAVAIRNNGVIINDMNTEELDALRQIILDHGSIKFQVIGYAKLLEKNQVVLMVDGGSLIYGEEGLVAATGTAKTILNLVYPADAVRLEEGVRRLTPSTTLYPNNPISPPPPQWLFMANNFDQHCSPFGISIFAKDWPKSKFLHVCNMMAQFLDNDQDGCADDIDVVKAMRANQAGMIMFATQDDYYSNIEWVQESFNGQSLNAEETELGCSGSSENDDCRDAAIEEVLHLITRMGLGPAYPTDFSDCESDIDKISTLQVEMDMARGDHFTSIPRPYPDSSIFSYIDSTCEYQCMTKEFIYLALTSQLDGQDNINSIRDEWKAYTPTMLQEKLPAMVDLLLNHENSMKLFSSNGILPGSKSATGATGTYEPSSQTCSTGCGLDGTGCGPQGYSLDVNRCDLNPSPVETYEEQMNKERLMNGEEACQNTGLTDSECPNVGDGSCCQWNEGKDKCWSAIGSADCPGTTFTPTVALIPSAALFIDTVSSTVPSTSGSTACDMNRRCDNAKLGKCYFKDGKTSRFLTHGERCPTENACFCQEEE